MNQEGYINEFLDSMKPILTDNDELLISDDKSSDNTVAELEEWVEKNKEKRIIIHKNHNNIGMGANCNQLIEMATHPILAWTDVDYYFPYRGEVIRALFVQPYDVMHTAYWKSGNTKAGREEIPIYGTDKNGYRVGAGESFDDRGKPKIQMSTVVERKAQAIKVPFSTAYKYHNLYWERFLRMRNLGARFLSVDIATTIWNRVIDNYDRKKSEIEELQYQILKEYGVNI